MSELPACFVSCLLASPDPLIWKARLRWVWYYPHVHSFGLPNGFFCCPASDVALRLNCDLEQILHLIPYFKSYEVFSSASHCLTEDTTNPISSLFCFCLTLLFLICRNNFEANIMKRRIQDSSLGQ